MPLGRLEHINLCSMPMMLFCLVKIYALQRLKKITCSLLLDSKEFGLEVNA